MTEEDLKPPQDSLGRLVSATAARAQQILSMMLAPHDLSPQQWIVLGVLWRKDGVSVGELARYMHSEKAAVSRLVDRMEKADWVRKCASCTDARSILVFATEKASQKSHLKTLYNDVNTILLKDFSPEDGARLFALLNRAHEHATDHISQA